MTAQLRQHVGSCVYLSFPLFSAPLSLTDHLSCLSICVADLLLIGLNPSRHLALSNASYIQHHIVITYMYYELPSNPANSSKTSLEKTA